MAICAEHGVDRYAILGDNLGRGDSAGCVERIRGIVDLSVIGNRDLDWAYRCGDDARAYILGLPRLLRAGDLVARPHGDARLTRDLSTSEIGAAFVRARHRMQSEGARLWFFGHSHRARVWRLSADGAAECLFDAASDPLQASFSLATPDPTLRWAINVGAAFPFPGKGPSSFAIYDAEANRVTFLPVS